MNINLNLPSECAELICVDVGGTNIKVCRLPTDLAEAISSIMAGEIKFTEYGWDPCASGPTLDKEILKMVGSISPSSRMVLAIPGLPISSNGQEYHGWLNSHHGVPVNLPKRLLEGSDDALIAVTMIHDSWAWGRGVQAVIRCHKKFINDAIGVLAIGTGIGFSIITAAQICTREVADERYDFKELFRYADPTNLSEPYRVHDHIGRKYFEWRKNQNWTESKSIEDQTKRLGLLCEQLQHQHNINYFIVTGGYANEYAKSGSIPEVKRVEYFIEQTLGFTHGFVPMLGMLQ